MANERENLRAMLADALTRMPEEGLHHGMRLGISDCLMEEILMDFEEGRMAVDTVVLVDAKNFVYANHWTHRFLTSKGRPTSVLFGCLNTLIGIAQHLPNAAFVFVWDGEGKTWRHRVSKGVYKANREEPNVDFKAALAQIPGFKEILDETGFRNFYVKGLEGDDLVGILATEIIKRDLFEKVIIKSSDKDFYQLLTDRVGVMRSYDKEKKLHPILFAKDMEQAEGVSPKDWVKVKALTGETTDNIPKIMAGLGPKTAIKYILAGLDPSKEDFKEHKNHIRCDFGPTFLKQWPNVRSNYSLSHILRDCEDERIDREEVGEQLYDLVKGLTRESFLRDRKKINDVSYEAFTNWVLEYEMDDLFGSRHELWKMP